MYNHNKAQQSKNRVHISWDILYEILNKTELTLGHVNIQATSWSSILVISKRGVNVFNKEKAIFAPKETNL